jgi:hypothetical protein
MDAQRIAILRIGAHDALLNSEDTVQVGRQSQSGQYSSRNGCQATFLAANWQLLQTFLDWSVQATEHKSTQESIWSSQTDVLARRDLERPGT